VAVEHPDSVVLWYVQGRDQGVDDRAALALSAQIIRSDFFESLRTEQQLGYSVGSTTLSPFDVPGLVMYVQSPNADAVRVDAAIREFVQQVTANVTPEQFARFQTALRQEILEPPKNLFERAEQYWQAIAKRDWDFSERERLAAAVAALDLVAWQAYFTDAVIAAPREVRAVAVGASGSLPGAADTVIDRPLQLRETLPVYSVP
jgi:insulysin